MTMKNCISKVLVYVIYVHYFLNLQTGKTFFFSDDGFKTPIQLLNQYKQSQLIIINFTIKILFL